MNWKQTALQAHEADEKQAEIDRRERFIETTKELRNEATAHLTRVGIPEADAERVQFEPQPEGEEHIVYFSLDGVRFRYHKRRWNSIDDPNSLYVVTAPCLLCGAYAESRPLYWHDWEIEKLGAILADPPRLEPVHRSWKDEDAACDGKQTMPYCNPPTED